MKMQDIKAIAADMGIKAGRIKKADLIRAIQVEEGNYDCFGSERIQSCAEQGCLWREDCVKEFNDA